MTMSDLNDDQRHEISLAILHGDLEAPFDAIEAVRRLAYEEGRRDVGDAVASWAMKNEIESPPLDWAWLGEIVRWSGSRSHVANQDPTPAPADHRAATTKTARNQEDA